MVRVTNMNVEILLDALGNESRRKILKLLSKKPCYVSEISYSLRMAPKVVLEHLEKLEKTGIVSSFEEGRRRYYYISRNVRLEIQISPHRFAVNVSEGRSGIGDIESLLRDIRENFNQMEKMRAETISEVYEALRRAEDLQKMFSRVQSALAAKFNDFAERITSEIEERLNDDLERLVMLSLAKGMIRAAEIAECFRIPYREVERILNSLARRGLIKKVIKDGEYIWVIR